ncbi:response regulator transcription factor [Specibacter sp. NPDC057265]|uniref:response regulator transcription factor n=1 Tax=Specibacter sp. NPDC057265 TaxID=3346075 RepID=UPI0036324914
METSKGALGAVVIDSDPDMRECLTALLTGMGYRVHTAGTAAEGVRLAREHHPVLVTTELHLPPPPGALGTDGTDGAEGTDGLDGIRQIQSFSNAYILVVAASSDPFDLYTALESVADDYIVKPFNPLILRARVAALARRPRNKRPAVPSIR